MLFKAPTLNLTNNLKNEPKTLCIWSVTHRLEIQWFTNRKTVEWLPISTDSVIRIFGFSPFSSSLASSRSFLQVTLEVRMPWYCRSQNFTGKKAHTNISEFMVDTAIRKQCLFFYSAWKTPSILFIWYHHQSPFMLGLAVYICGIILKNFVVIKKKEKKNWEKEEEEE